MDFIGATTENPSLEVIPALLSRIRMFVLQELTKNDTETVVSRTGCTVDQEVSDVLIAIGRGDARQILMRSHLQTTYSALLRLSDTKDVVSI